MRPPRARIFHAQRSAVVVALLLGACARPSEDDPRFSNFCDPARVSACDVRERECQQAVYSYAACLTERPEREPPRVKVLASTSTAVFRPENHLLDAARPGLSLLGLAGRVPEPAPAAEQWYNAELDEVFMVERDDDFARPAMVATLAKLMTFSLQTTSGDAQALFAGAELDGDRFTALDAVRRGEASLVGDLFWRAFRIDEGTAERFQHWSAYRQPELDLEESASPLELGQQLFSEREGAQLVRGAWEREGNGGVHALFRSPLESTTEILRLTREYVPDPQAALEKLRAELTPVRGAPSLPIGLEHYQLDGDVVLGRWGHLLFTQRLLHAVEKRNEGPEEAVDVPNAFTLSAWNAALRGDRLWSYTSVKTGARAFVWVVRSNDPYPLRRISSTIDPALEAVGEPWRFLEKRGTSVLVGCDDPTQLGSWLQVGAALLDAPDLPASD